jgi:hypothetical protein
MTNERVLFISHDPFSETGSNGKTYLSLFTDFEDGQMGQLYFNNLRPGTKKFNTFFRITYVDILKFIFSFLSYKITGKVEKEEVKAIKANIMKRSLLKSELIKILRNFLHNLVGVHKNESFIRWIGEFKPTVIFCAGTNYVFIYKTVEEISKKYQIPYYIYFTDDYYKYNNGNNFVTKFLHQRFVAKTKHIVSGAQELFVISPKMREEYQDYFGRRCSILINAIDKEALPDIKTKLSSTVVFRYFGWLHSNRSSSLRYLAECLQYLNEKFSTNCILEVYTLTVPLGKTKSDLDINTIRVCDPLMGQELRNKVLTSDFLVHAESFEPEDMQITSLSISTKIPEYLISNRCTVVVGPSKLASISIFKENDLGIAITEKNETEKYVNEIYKVMHNMQAYNDFCKKSQDFYDKEFDAKVMRSTLKEKLLKN